METTSPSLIKVAPSLWQTTEEVLFDNTTDSDKFQSLYYDILESKALGEDEPLAQRVGPLSQPQLYLL